MSCSVSPVRMPRKLMTRSRKNWSERDDIPGASGHRMPKNGFDEEPVGEELVSDGIEEAAHDQMLQARREELEEERREK